VGVPVDALAAGAGDIVGKGDAVASYLNDLKRYHPLESTGGELAGQTAGLVVGGALTGGAGAAADAGAGFVARAGRAAHAGALRGGVEQLVVGTTTDVNEAALGDPKHAAEKILANVPKHFGVGAAGGALGGVAGEAFAEAYSALRGKAPELLERGANAAIGRELGGDAALGAEARAAMGGKVPRSGAEVLETLTGKQTAARAASEAEAVAARDAFAGKNVADAAKLSIEQEASRVRMAKEAREGLAELARGHAEARTALSSKTEAANAAAEAIEKERGEVRKQFSTLADSLDKVKGAERPSALRIAQAAQARFGAVNELTPMTENATRILDEWGGTFMKQHGEGMTFRQLQEAMKTIETAQVRQRVVSGVGNDPEIARAFDALKSAAREEFERAAEQTALSVSEAKGLSFKTLKQRIPELDKAAVEARKTAAELEAASLKFDRDAGIEMKIAEAQAKGAAKQFERGVKKADGAFDQATREGEKGLPKASKSTPVDDLLGRVRRGVDGKKEAPGGGLAGNLSLAALIHGNVAGVAMAALGGMAGKVARAEGNLLAARTMSSLAEALRRTDGAVESLAGKAIGRYVRQAADEDIPKEPKRRLSFERTVAAVRDAQADPLIIRQRVQQTAGLWAKDAPMVFGELMSAAIRQQEFLASKLPQSRIDPNSLQPHLQDDHMSDSQKYDFMEYARACDDPIGAMKAVISGGGSPQAVEAVQATYPQLYEQTKKEIATRIQTMRKPLTYEQEVNIGTLLGIETNAVMTGSFQTTLREMYAARLEAEKMDGGSKPKGANARLSHSVESAGQKMQSGGQP